MPPAIVANTAWGYWNADYVTGCGTSCVTVEFGSWPSWNQQYLNQTGVTQATDTWIIWNQNYCSSQTFISPPPPAIELTEEQRAANERRAADRAAEHLKKQQAKELACQKATELLFHFLTGEQKNQYQERGYFETTVKERTYRIKKGRSGNVQLIEKGKPRVQYCVHPEEDVPDQDTMLAQLLLLRTDESEFLRLANHTQLS